MEEVRFMDKTYHSMTELLEADAVYQELEQQRQNSLSVFRTVIGQLTEEQRDAIVEYIGIAEEQHWRAMELLAEGAEWQGGILP
jgi:ABC-type phosphate/phosphonate transport system ATPase subunit